MGDNKSDPVDYKIENVTTATGARIDTITKTTRRISSEEN